MTDRGGHPAVWIGYCTNVHAGRDWTQTRANLERHALAVKAAVSPARPMGIGLWLSQGCVAELLGHGMEPRDAELAERNAAACGVTSGGQPGEPRAGELREWLEAHGLVAFTFNGFPQGDFHEPVVKHRVYEPDWRTPQRLAYTLDLARIMTELLPEGGEGSISTLPVGWGRSLRQPGAAAAAARHLLEAAEHLARVESDSGRCIHLDLEPEPGCFLERSADVVDFFKEHFFARSRDEDLVRRHLRVCHDICHAAVMFESQTEALQRYRAAGIAVGKVQVSSAVRVQFDRLTPQQRWEARVQLGEFKEDRYLHQTVIRRPHSAETTFHDDLAEALAGLPADTPPAGEWRVHFHVPIYCANSGLIDTTRSDIYECLEEIAKARDVRHFEVETYAWNVLPAELQAPDLATGIARELDWVNQAFSLNSSLNSGDSIQIQGQDQPWGTDLS